jgi:hypothetical protein
MSNGDYDRVRESTAENINIRLDEERVTAVAQLADASQEQITQRLEELDQEWDIERVLEANAATIALVAVVLSTRSRWWLLLAGIVPTFLLQHAVQGWCPPIELFRRLGIRTRREIDAERTALKAMRGDFSAIGRDGADPRSVAEQALAAAGRR